MVVWSCGLVCVRVYIHVHVYVQVCVKVHVHLCVQARSQPWMSSSVSVYLTFLRWGLSLSVGHTCLSLLVDQQTPGFLPALSFQCFYYACILQHLALKLGAEELSSSPPMLWQQASCPLSLLSCLPVAFGTWFLSSRLPAQVELATSAFLLVFHVLTDMERVN